MRTSSRILRGPSGKGTLFLLAVIIALSAYTHMWNPAGFPALYHDESIYVKRGVGVLGHEVLYGSYNHPFLGQVVRSSDDTGCTASPTCRYDHPFLGQVVIAGFLHVTGYPNLFDKPQTDPSYLEAFYAYPRAFMGLLAVLDTLLVYLIADRMFGRRVAAVAAVIFAVAPMSLLLRMVLLDSILLPFALSSVLLALHSRGPGNDNGRRRHALLLASGACMGLAILTKVPAVAMVPPCAILAYWASGRIRDVGLWLAPALAIPVAWPAYAVRAGQFDLWIRDVMYMSGRSDSGLPDVIMRLFEYDPILIPLGMAGFAFVVICLVLRLCRGRRAAGTAGVGKSGDPSHDPSTARRPVSGNMIRAGRDEEPDALESRNLGFLTAWFSSILLFFVAIGFVSFYHLSMLLPALCVAAAVLILEVAGRAGRLTRGAGGSTQDRTALIAVAAIGLAGLLTTGIIVYSDGETSEFEAASFLLRNYSDDPNTVKVVQDKHYWVLLDVYGLQNMTSLTDYKAHVGGAFVGSGHAVQGAAGFSDHYVQPDAERVILMFDSQDKQHFVDTVESCDYAADSANRYCHNAYSMLRLYNDGNLIREFKNKVPVDVFPQIPPNVERHWTNPSRIVEWSPAK